MSSLPMFSFPDSKERNSRQQLPLENISRDVFPPDGQPQLHKHSKCSPVWQFSHLVAGNKKRTDSDAHTFFLFPLLSNLGHILCGRLGHTIPLGFEGIWWTSGSSLNLNIWITERCVNETACLTFSFLKLNHWVPRVNLSPSSVYSSPLRFTADWLTQSARIPSSPLYLHVSLSFKMYIHTELNITVMLLLSVPSSLTHADWVSSHSDFMTAFSPLSAVLPLASVSMATARLMMGCISWPRLFSQPIIR